MLVLYNIYLKIYIDVFAMYAIIKIYKDWISVSDRGFYVSWGVDELRELGGSS